MASPPRPELTAADLWARLPADLRERFATFKDDPRRTEQLMALLGNMAANVAQAERELAAALDAAHDDDDDER